MKNKTKFTLFTLFTAIVNLFVVEVFTVPRVKEQAIKEFKIDLLTHPNFLQELVDAYQDKIDIEQKNIMSQLVYLNINDIKKGILIRQNKNTPITIVAFTDYQCAICSNISKLIDDIGKDRRIQIIYHDLPIDHERNPVGLMAARIGIEIYHSKGMKMYLKYRRKMFSLVSDGSLTKVNINKVLNDLSISKNDLDFLGNNQDIEAEISLLKNLDLRVNPLLIVMPSSKVKTKDIYVINNGAYNEIKEALGNVRKKINDYEHNL